MMRGPANDGISFANVERVGDGVDSPDVTLATDGKTKEYPHITCLRC